MIVGRIAESPGGRRNARPDGAADIAAGAELPREFRLAAMPVATVRSCSEAVLS